MLKKEKVGRLVSTPTKAREQGTAGIIDGELLYSNLPSDTINGSSIFVRAAYGTPIFVKSPEGIINA